MSRISGVAAAVKAQLENSPVGSLIKSAADGSNPLPAERVYSLISSLINMARPLCGQLSSAEFVQVLGNVRIPFEPTEAVPNPQGSTVVGQTLANSFITNVNTLLLA